MLKIKKEGVLLEKTELDFENEGICSRRSTLSMLKIKKEGVY
jgi:hypothetical protein